MWFKVISKDLNNNKYTHYFNNVQNLIKDSNLIPIDFTKDPRLSVFVGNPRKPKKREFKKPNVDVLRIQLGLNCNFSCKYCHQKKCQDAAAAVKKVNLPLEISIKNFMSMLDKYNIQVNTRINLWGGEPLVYWKHIQLLVPRLVQKYPGIPICLITNGSLINEKIIDFCIKYRINITLSHDAQGFNAYRDDKDPLDNPLILKALKRYIDASEKSFIDWQNLSDLEKSDINTKIYARPFGFSINVVITPANLKLDKIDAYFFLKFGRKVRFHFESMVKAGVETKKLMGSLSKDQINTISNQIFKLASINSVDWQENPYYSLRELTSHILRQIVNRVDRNNYEVICDVASSRNLAVDLQGNILACHGADAEHWSIGHLSTVTSTINNKVIGWKERPHCPNCPFVAYCGGGCVIASNEDSLSMCEYLKIYHGSLFASAWLNLFNLIIERIEPCPEMED